MFSKLAKVLNKQISSAARALADYKFSHHWMSITVMIRFKIKNAVSKKIGNLKSKFI